MKSAERSRAFHQIRSRLVATKRSWPLPRSAPSRQLRSIFPMHFSLGPWRERREQSEPRLFPAKPASENRGSSLEKSHALDRRLDPVQQHARIKTYRERGKHQQYRAALFRKSNRLFVVPVSINRHNAVVYSNVFEESLLQRPQGERGNQHHPGSGNPDGRWEDFPCADQNRDLGGETTESWNSH